MSMREPTSTLGTMLAPMMRDEGLRRDDELKILCPKLLAREQRSFLPRDAVGGELEQRVGDFINVVHQRSF